jgi:uncharacterized membrane protein YbhN (UPF0104 family)
MSEALAGTRKRGGGWIRLALAVVGIALAVLFTWLSFREVGFAAVREALSQVEPAWLVAGALVYGGSLVVRGLRWRLLILRKAEVSRGTMIGGLLVGFAMNLALPGRLGELYRADYIGTQAGISRSTALGTIFVERVLDGLLLVGLLVLSSLALGLGDGSRPVPLKFIVSASALFSLAFVGFLALRRYDLPIPVIGGLLAKFKAGLKTLDRRNAALFLVLTLGVWALELAALALTLEAVQQTPTLIGVCLVLSASSLSTLLPTAPAFVGSFQFAYVLCFQALRWATPTALAASILVQLAFYVPTMLIGSLVLAWGSFKRVKA